MAALDLFAAEAQQVMPLAQQPGTFVSLATIQQPDAHINADGTVSNGFTIFAANVPCMDAPPSMARVQATEVKAIAEIMAKGLRHVLLSRFFADAPNWSGKGWRVAVDGVTYDLLGAENDSQNTQTRLDLQLVTV